MAWFPRRVCPAASFSLSPTLDRLQLQPLVYRAGLALRLRRPELGEIVTDLDQWLAVAAAGEGASWEQREEGELFLQSLASGLAPLAGLDVAAARLAFVRADQTVSNVRPGCGPAAAGPASRAGPSSGNVMIGYDGMQ